MTLQEKNSTACLLESRLRDRLIIGLDLPDTRSATALIEELGTSVSHYKIGYQLAFSGGLDLARELVEDGKKLFLDMKLFDIENTVAKAVEKIAAMGVNMLTVHAFPKVMKAAFDAARGSSLSLLGVTVLTSMDEQDLSEAGYACSRKELVIKRTQKALEIGMRGVVCLPTEAAAVRQITGPDFAIVTPGIRPGGYSGEDDHALVMTPACAVRHGASHIVIARPVLTATDKMAFISRILSQMQEAEISLSSQSSILSPIVE